MNTTNQYEKGLLKVAEISAKSTIKYLWEKWAMDYTEQLRFGQLADFRLLEIEGNIIDEMGELEKRVTEINEEVKLVYSTIAELKDAMDSMSKRQYEDARNECLILDDYIKSMHAERKRANERINLLYSKMGQCLTDGIDLYQIGVVAVWECLPIIKAYARHGKLDVNNVGALVVECYTVKSTGAKKYLTLKAYADREIRRYINQWRTGTASKTQYIIVGADEDGNDLLLQNSKLETLGGVDSWEEKQAFFETWGKLEGILTSGQLEVVKLLLQGKTQEEIAKKLGVKQNTISEKIKRIREKVKNSSIEGAKKF